MLSAAELEGLKNDLRDFYNNFPRYVHMNSYEQVRKLTSDDKYVKYILKYLQPNMEVLDVGCGAGLLTMEMCKIAKKVIGVDISQKTIAFAEAMKQIEYRRHKLIEDSRRVPLRSRNMLDVQFIVGDAEKMLFEDNTFDLIVAQNIIEHLPAPIVAINLMLKILKKGGHLILILNTPVIDTNLNIESWQNSMSDMKNKDALNKMNFNMLKSWFKRKNIKITEYCIDYSSPFIRNLTRMIPLIYGDQAFEKFEERITFVIKKEDIPASPSKNAIPPEE